MNESLRLLFDLMFLFFLELIITFWIIKYYPYSFNIESLENHVETISKFCLKSSLC